MRQKFFLALLLTLISGIYKPNLAGFLAMVGYGFPLPYFVSVIGTDMIGAPFVPYIDWRLSMVGLVIDVAVWLCFLLFINKLLKTLHIKLPVLHK